MFLSSLFVWLFIATSLILCYTFLRLNPSELGVKHVFGDALLLSMTAALPLAFALRVMSPRILLGRVKGLRPATRNLEKSFATLACLMRVPTPELRVFKSNVPISFVVETGRPTVVLSDRIQSLLTKEEIRAVLAHELAHIKNSDTMLKAMVTAYRTVLPFDPIIRMIEATFHREREMLADETSVRVTKKPLFLASALLKIHKAFPKRAFSSQGALSIFGISAALTNRHPSVSDRINHLKQLAQNYSMNIATHATSRRSDLTYVD